jgi:glucose 1-dehydrogenase
MRVTNGKQLQGRTALVTGADSGIGRAVATTFAREGADVVVHYHEDQRGAEQTAHAAAEHGVRAVVLQADLSDPRNAAPLFEQAVAALGRVDILVNNAGKGIGKDSSLDIPLEAFQEVINLDLVSPFVLATLAAKGMVERGSGAIVNVSSVHEEIPSPGNAAYDCAKGGLRMMARTLGVELAPHKVRVTNVGPGMTTTPMTAERLLDPEQGAQAMERLPMGRPAEPQEIADAVLFLASDQASYITGITLFVDGGLMRNVGGA